jgi:hypothetical protein
MPLPDPLANHCCDQDTVEYANNREKPKHNNPHDEEQR